MKTRATTTDAADTANKHEYFQEAQTLYQQVLLVQHELLHSSHPDVYATKHSLAELLGAMGDTQAANEIRHEIVDACDPPTT